eukprot:jgi/Mesvir1/14083/Mv14776-RA.1
MIKCFPAPPRMPQGQRYRSTTMGVDAIPEDREVRYYTRAPTRSAPLAGAPSPPSRTSASSSKKSSLRTSPSYSASSSSYSTPSSPDSELPSKAPTRPATPSGLRDAVRSFWETRQARHRDVK